MFFFSIESNFFVQDENFQVRDFKEWYPVALTAYHIDVDVQLIKKRNDSV